MTVALHLGDCLDVLAAMDADSVDSIVTDPPYGLEFMGKEWDAPWRNGKESKAFSEIAPGTLGGFRALPQHSRVNNVHCEVCGKWRFSSSPCTCARPRFENARLAAMRNFEAWCTDWAVAALRVAKPGAHILAFGGTRTFHRLACAIEDAGWEIRDTIGWLYGQGFPKSMAADWKLHLMACNACGYMVEYGNDNKQPERSLPEAEHDLRFVRGTYLSTPVYACAECGQVLQPFMSEQESQAIRAAWAKSETIWPEQSGMEGRGDVEASKGELQGCSVCEMSHGVLADGAEGWLRDGASPRDGAVPWQAPNADGGRPSYRPQSREQLDGQPEAFRIERAAQTHRGFGTALKPSWEPIIVARKPLAEGTVAANVLAYGTGAINIDGCRVGTEEVFTSAHKTLGDGIKYGKSKPFPASPIRVGRWPSNLLHDGSEEVLALFPETGPAKAAARGGTNPNPMDWGNTRADGRAVKGHDDNGGSAARFFKTCAFTEEDNEWLHLSSSDRYARRAESPCASCETYTAPDPAAIRPLAFRSAGSPVIAASIGSCSGCTRPLSLALCAERQESIDTIPTTPGHSKSSGSASPVTTASILEIEKPGQRRFTYCPKASKADRDGGLEGMDATQGHTAYGDFAGTPEHGTNMTSVARHNGHPTVKPTALMRWLVRLVTPPGGVILDPFAGSGSTGKAAVLEGFGFVGIELDAEYLEIARRRIAAAQMQPPLMEIERC